MKDPKEIAVEALFSAVVPSGLLVLTLALAGVNPEEWLAVIRAAPGEDRAILAALLLASLLLVFGVWRRWGASLMRPRRIQAPAISAVESPQSLAVPAVSPPMRATPENLSRSRTRTAPTAKGSPSKPKTALGHVEVGDFIPKITQMEHGTVKWITTMPPIQSFEIGETYTVHPDAIGVRLPPVCPRCGTDLLEDHNNEAELANLLIGRGPDVYCVDCEFRTTLPKPVETLHAEVTLKARGVVRGKVARQDWGSGTERHSAVWYVTASLYRLVYHRGRTPDQTSASTRTGVTLLRTRRPT